MDKKDIRRGIAVVASIILFAVALSYGNYKYGEHVNRQIAQSPLPQLDPVPVMAPTSTKPLYFPTGEQFKNFPDEKGVVTPLLCMRPSAPTSVTCWGYPSRDGTSLRTVLSLSKGEVRCCPSGLDAAFTVPTSVTGSYIGHSGDHATRSFEELATGAFGGSR